MKTVSGEVVSTTPISLSKAAKTLSNFASSDNGASPAFAAYLKRASASFDELAQLRKKYKASGGERRGRKQHCESNPSEETVCSVEDRIKFDHRKNKRRESCKGKTPEYEVMTT